MGKKARALRKIYKAIRRREERRMRRLRSGVEFNAHQLSNAVKMDQKLILMGK
jgi:hypothetical protein